MSPAELISIASVTTVAFVATNVDNLFLLVAYLSAARSSRSVYVGFVAAIVSVLLLGWASQRLDAFLEPSWLRFLGLVPLAMGLYRLVNGRGGSEAVAEASAGPASAVGVGVVTLTNAGDSLGVFVPLFADSEDRFGALIFAVGVAWALLWCSVARWLESHRSLGGALRTAAPRALPWLLIALGLYILADTPTDAQSSSAEGRAVWMLPSVSCRSRASG